MPNASRVRGLLLATLLAPAVPLLAQTPAVPAKPAAAPVAKPAAPAAAPAAAAAAKKADAKNGQARFEAACAECHEAAELKGPAGKAFGAKAADIVAGKAKHKPRLKITAAEAADIAAYVATLK